LADVIEAHGEGMARATQWQNLVVRWVHENELPALHRELNATGLADSPAPVLRNTVACAGASTCKLGICLSRGLARAVIDRLSSDALDLEEVGNLTIQISGCPNSCGRHPVAGIGLFGAARRIGGRLVPHYVLQLGGRVSEGNTKLAQGEDAVPARNVPALIAELLAAFQGSPQWPDYDEFLEAQGYELAGQLAAKYKHVPPFEEDKNYYFDWEADTLFSLAGRGPGECGAGVFDLIEVDLASAKEALQAGKLLAATVLAARALLVTQGREARDEEDALKLFTERFIDAGLVSESFQALIENARRAAGAAEREESFAAGSEDVSALVEAVQNLYDNMDASLRFKPAESDGGAAQPEDTCCADPRCCRRADFRGVVCPLNYVKTKLLLEQMEKGEVLSVLLDEEGARNVPESAEQDGHEVLSAKQDGDQWRVLIKKS
jgi:sulfite reductase (ferredoxin)